MHCRSDCSLLGEDRRGTASFGVRRVRFEQVGLHVPADWFERAQGSNEMVMVPAREGAD